MINSARYSQFKGFFPSSDQAACDLFSRAYARGQFLQAWSFLTGKPRSLRSLQSIDGGCVDAIQEKAGVQIVPISQICGSEGRSHDFDSDFHPLTDCTRDRWKGIASTRLRGKPLPPIVLVQVGDRYFVRDGHHRISVARALRDTVIQARVIVWHVSGRNPQKAS